MSTASTASTAESRYLYKKYKNACEDVFKENHIQNSIEGMNMKQLQAHRRYLKNIYNKSVKCAELRSQFRESYVPEVEWNVGHDMAIKKAMELAVESLEKMNLVDHKIAELRAVNDASWSLAHLQSPQIPMQIPMQKLSIQDTKERDPPMSSVPTGKSKSHGKIQKPSKLTPSKIDNTGSNDNSLLVAPSESLLDLYNEIFLLKTENLAYPFFHALTDFNLHKPIAVNLILKDIIQRTLKVNPNVDLKVTQCQEILNAFGNYSAAMICDMIADIQGYAIIIDLFKTDASCMKIRFVFNKIIIKYIVPCKCSISKVESIIHKIMGGFMVISKNKRKQGNHGKSMFASDFFEYDELVELIPVARFQPTVTKTSWRRSKAVLVKDHPEMTLDDTAEIANEKLRAKYHLMLASDLKKVQLKQKRAFLTFKVHCLQNPSLFTKNAKASTSVA